MADWKKLAKVMTLSDGRIDTKEVNLLRENLFADGKIDKSELEFLADLRKSAESTVQAFDELYIAAVKSHMLADGEISDAETKWLRKTIFADQNVDATEKKLLAELKAGAKSVSSEFTKLCQEVGV